MSFLSAARRCPWKDSSASSSSGDTPDRNKRAAPAAPPSAGAGAGASELSLFGGLQLGRFGKEELRCCYILRVWRPSSAAARSGASALGADSGRGRQARSPSRRPSCRPRLDLCEGFLLVQATAAHTAHSGHDPLMGIQHWSKAVSD